MGLPARARSLFDAFFRRSRLERGMAEEMRFHIESYAADLERGGLAPAEAGRRARLAFGSLEARKEECREARGLRWADELRSNLRFAGRTLRKSPAFTAAAVLTLALGIGLNTTVFTVYNAVALRPLPVRDASRVVRALRVFQDGGRSDRFSYPEYDYLRGHNTAFAGLLATSGLLPIPAGEASGGEIIHGRLVSGNYFSLLGERAVLGRTFLPEEDQDVPVVVLSHRFWERRFASDPEILDRTLTLNGERYTIAGVASPDFAGTGGPPQVPDVWIPLARQPRIRPGLDWFHQYDARELQILGRLRADVSRRQAETETALLAAQFAQAHPDGSPAPRLVLTPALYFETASGEFDTFRTVILILLAAVTALLLIGCVNLVSLLLARAAARRREIAIRLALGAGRGRLVRQLCTESALLGLAGGALGLLFSTWICRGMWTVFQRYLAEVGGGLELLIVDLRPDLRVFIYTLALSLLVGMLVGLVPALRASRTAVSGALKEESLRMARGPLGITLRDLLVAAQTAACLVLLAGAGFLLRGLLKAGATDPGFETRHVLLMSLPPRESAARIRRVVDRLEALPQVESVSLAMQVPLGGHSSTMFTAGAGRNFSTLYNTVSARYFETLGVPIVRGRAFTRQEMEQPASVVIVSEATAQRLWPGEDPLGRRIQAPKWVTPARLANRGFTVIGVARSVRSTNLSKVDPSYLYFPFAYTDWKNFLVRSAGPVDRVYPAVRRALADVAPDLPGSAFLLGLEKGPLQLQKLISQAPAVAAATLGLLALLLAAVGIYGVVSYAVSQRTREIGIRMALGAGRASVLGLVLRQGMRPVLWGAAGGLAGALALSRLLASVVAQPEAPDLLFGASPWSPAVYAGALLFLAAVALLSGWAPARRAVRVDPVAALRWE